MTSYDEESQNSKSDPLDKLQDILAEGFEEERTSVVNLHLPQPPAAPRSLIPGALGASLAKIPDTWTMRLIAIVLALIAIAAVMKQLAELVGGGHVK